jgi:hypothetical protein
MVNAWNQSYAVKPLGSSWMSSGTTGVLTMHRTECFVASTVGGFKIINGPPNKGKGLMDRKEDLEPSNETSPPNPARVGRIETCSELMNQAMECLSKNDVGCVMGILEELVKDKCHDGRLASKEIAYGVKEIVHKLWLRGNDELRRELLTKLMVELSVSRNWFRSVFNTNTRMLNKWLGRYVLMGDQTAQQNMMTRPPQSREDRWRLGLRMSEVIDSIEEMLRHDFGWSERFMCEKMWKFVGVDVDAFREYSVDPCQWLNALTAKELNDTRWLGWYITDMVIKTKRHTLYLRLNTTNTISAIHFVTILKQIQTPNINMNRKSKTKIGTEYFIRIPRTSWPWPLDKAEAISMLRRLGKVDLRKALAAATDGDGSVNYYGGVAIFNITFGVNDIYEVNILGEILQQYFGVTALITRNEEHGYMNMRLNGNDAVSVLGEIVPFMTHPLRRLRADLILVNENGELSQGEFEKLYDMTKYRGMNDIKRKHAIEVLTQAAPQTTTIK